MYDPKALEIQTTSYKQSMLLRSFKSEWYEYCFETFHWPTIVLDKDTSKFIIKVPLSVSKKVQYVPFIYKEFKTEIYS